MISISATEVEAAMPVLEEVIGQQDITDSEKHCANTLQSPQAATEASTSQGESAEAKFEYAEYLENRIEMLEACVQRLKAENIKLQKMVHLYEDTFRRMQNELERVEGLRDELEDMRDEFEDVEELRRIWGT